MKSINNKSISVIIPVYNDPNGLSDTLDSLVSQDYPKQQYEIIVADNDSNDNTLDMARSFKEKYPELIHIVVENNIQSSYAARNKGIKISKGKIIAFVDADMTVEKDWLKNITKSIERNSADYLICKVNIYLNKNNIFGLFDKMIGFPIEEYVNKKHFGPTCCLIVKKKVFEQVGLFDSRLISSGDYEFGNRLFALGYKLYYDANIIMNHPARSSFKKLVSKSFRIGRGTYQIIIYFPKYFNEFYHNILNIKYYLPDKPWCFFKEKKKYEIWNKSSFLEKIFFYFINWAIKLANQFGYVYEKYK